MNCHHDTELSTLMTMKSWTNQQSKPRQVAVVGAGLAGAACARALAEAGHHVTVLDKARGPGGRLATRRVEWFDAQGQAHVCGLDHGTPWFDARSAAMRQFVDAALAAGWLATWQPRIVGGRSGGAVPVSPHYVAVPTMPTLCQRLLDAPALTRLWQHTVTAIKPAEAGRAGWQVSCAGERLPMVFDAVMLAMPPAQAAVLLRPWRVDWAERAEATPMSPCWTLLGVSEALGRPADWDMALPDSGPLARIVQHRARPGRAMAPADQAHWVAHARVQWSQAHLEHSPAGVQAQLQEALAQVLGQPLRWHHVTVHRWRYALTQPDPARDLPACWWDATQGLGVCGDFLGGYGVEGAWLSGQALAASVLEGVV